MPLFFIFVIKFYIIMKLKVDYSTLKYIRKDIAEQVAKHDITCKKGCSSCCYQFISYYNFEKEYIKSAIKSLKPNLKEKIHQNFEITYNHLKKYYPESKEVEFHDIMTDYIKPAAMERVKCPLLVDNMCAIYNDRPISCITHFSKENPQKCYDNPLKLDEDSTAIQGRFTMFLVQKHSAHIIFDSMVMLCKEIFDKKGDGVVIKKSKF